MKVTPLTVCSSVNMDFTLSTCMKPNLSPWVWAHCVKVSPLGHRAIEIIILDDVHTAGQLYSTHVNFAQFMDEVYVSLGPVGAPLNPDTLQEAVNHIVVKDLSKEMMKYDGCGVLDDMAMISEEIDSVEWQVHNSMATVVREGNPHHALGWIVDDIKQTLCGSVER